MIKALIERHAKRGEDLLIPLRQIRTEAMRQPGYITSETLVSIEEKNTIIVISSWESLAHWKAWETSEARIKLYKQTESLLVEGPRVKTYRYLSYRTAKED